MEINNRVFIVTGGSSGLGAATVRALRAGGAKAVIADVNAKAGEALAAELGTAARFVRCDITSEDDAKAAVDAALALGGLSGLINCAGIPVMEKTLGKNGPHSLQTFTRCININLIGTFNMIRTAAAAMAEQPPTVAGERGVIVNTASVAAFDGQIGQVAYAASKAGVVGMTLPIARDLSRLGIRVCTIAPGIFATPMMDALPLDVQESLGKMVPFPSRLGRPEEYAALALHIVQNEMLNGEVIRLDGAIRMQPK